MKSRMLFRKHLSSRLMITALLLVAVFTLGCNHSFPRQRSSEEQTIGDPDVLVLEAEVARVEAQISSNYEMLKGLRSDMRRILRRQVLATAGDAREHARDNYVRYLSNVKNLLLKQENALGKERTFFAGFVRGSSVRPRPPGKGNTQ
jgi:hypothetical protein